MPKSKTFQKIAKVNQRDVHHLLKNNLCSASITLKRLHEIYPKRHRDYPKVGVRRQGGRGKTVSDSSYLNFLNIFKKQNNNHNKDGI